MKILQSKEWLAEKLSNLYDSNPYINLLDMHITKLEDGQAEISMPIIAGKHTNLYNIAHGGALASLADTAMGIACVTTGKKVVTLEMNVNFIKGAVPQAEIKAVGKIIHRGKSTMIAEGEIRDGHNTLLIKSRGTFFVIGDFEEV